MNQNAISLFSSSGIGDLGLKANGINTNPRWCVIGT